MKRSPLSKAYVKELNEHPFVEKATEWTVSFTPEFKQQAYDEYCRGKTMREVFSEAGFDVERIGSKRLENFRNHMVKKAEEETGFADKRREKSLQAQPSTEAQMMKRIRELEHRNAYLEQENEKIKKIQQLEEDYGGKAAKRK